MYRNIADPPLLLSFICLLFVSYGSRLMSCFHRTLGLSLISNHINFNYSQIMITVYQNINYICVNKQAYEKKDFKKNDF